MALTKTINIDGVDAKFRASAAVPRMYRIKFGRDIYKDLRQLKRLWEKETRLPATWTCSPLKCSRTSRG